MSSLSQPLAPSNQHTLNQSLLPSSNTLPSPLRCNKPRVSSWSPLGGMKSPSSSRHVSSSVPIVPSSSCLSDSSYNFPSRCASPIQVSNKDSPVQKSFLNSQAMPVGGSLASREVAPIQRDLPENLSSIRINEEMDQSSDQSPMLTDQHTPTLINMMSCEKRSQTSDTRFLDENDSNDSSAKLIVNIYKNRKRQYSSNSSGDRFIPNHASVDIDVAHFSLTNKLTTVANDTENQAPSNPNVDNTQSHGQETIIPINSQAVEQIAYERSLLLGVIGDSIGLESNDHPVDMSMSMSSAPLSPTPRRRSSNGSRRSSGGMVVEPIPTTPGATPLNRVKPSTSSRRRSGLLSFSMDTSRRDSLNNSESMSIISEDNSNRCQDGMSWSPHVVERVNVMVESISAQLERQLAFRNDTRMTMESVNAASVHGSRYVSQNPIRILDAPDLVDDFYLNLLDWNTDNILAVALGSVVYLWNAETGGIEELMQTDGENNFVTSLAWVNGNSSASECLRGNGSTLAIGTNTAEVQLWDTSALKKIHGYTGHEGRVGSLCWNGSLLCSGSRDANINVDDIRQAMRYRPLDSTVTERISGGNVAVLQGHRQEVCGLKWSPDGSQLASGGNDNILNIWDASYSLGSPTSQPSSGARRHPRFAERYTIEHHQAAVKAIAWCPWQRHLLASGGGTADKMLCFWNTSTGKLIKQIDTKSQVCSIQWSKNDRELVTSHGFSQNQLSLWNYPSLTKIAEMRGHTSRVLHMASSPDGSTVVSAAADETLRFWQMFKPSNAKGDSQRSSAFAPWMGDGFVGAIPTPEVNSKSRRSSGNGNAIFTIR